MDKVYAVESDELGLIAIFKTDASARDFIAEQSEDMGYELKDWHVCEHEV